MSTHRNARDADLDTTQIRIYETDKRRLNEIADQIYQVTGRRPSYPMLVKSLIDNELWVLP